jgi:hypothetical protein
LLVTMIWGAMGGDSWWGISRLRKCVVVVVYSFLRQS